jgi:hypothetical protein
VSFAVLTTPRPRPVVLELDEHEAQFVLNLVRSKAQVANLENDGAMAAYWSRISSRVKAGIEGHYQRARLVELGQADG